MYIRNGNFVHIEIIMYADEFRTKTLLPKSIKTCAARVMKIGAHKFPTHVDMICGVLPQVMRVLPTSEWNAEFAVF